ncbi:MAG TPA: FHA domain-containing protein [Thermoanaerobaculia bacterium]|nr:FHA domain-containing protein [Thermoanaerobaculia bacterium]
MRIRFGPFVFDSELREVARGGKRIPLTPKAYAMLEALVRIRPQPLSRQQLAELLWPETVVEQGNLHNLASEIRKALDDDDHQIIRTVHRFGYAFDAAGTVEDSAQFVLMIGDEEVPLRNGENVIGRDSADAIVIPDAEVSRHHASLVVDGATVTLHDLGSKNGTFLEGKKVSSPSEVKPGDAIVIGKTLVRLAAAGVRTSTKTAT